MSMVWFFLVRFVINAYARLFEFVAHIDQFNPASSGDWQNLAYILFFAGTPWFLIYINVFRRSKTKKNVQ